MFNQGLKNRNVYHVIILDESGSMIPKKSAVVAGFKEYVQEISRAQMGGTSKHFITLITFNSSVSTKLDSSMIAALASYSIDTSYNPNGMTALFDAIGTGIALSKPFDGEYSTFIFNIFTDGEENSSREYTQSQIQKMISGLRHTNRWVFNYMGVEENAVGTAKAMGIGASNVMRYANTSEGTTRSMSTLAKAAVNYSVALEKGASLSTEDFFKEGIRSDD